MSAAYPQCFPTLTPGSQFGPRVFKGAQTFHKGRDQAAGNGSVRRAPAAGVVIAHGQNVLHGHWIAVRYHGGRHVERMHQVQAGSRLPVGTQFKTGDALAKVGHPHLWLTEAARQRRADWSGGSKKSSTGSHSHQEIERDELGGISIDPAGAEAAADWARITAHQKPQLAPASSGSKPITIAQEDDDMIHVSNRATTGTYPGWQGTVGLKYARHFTDKNKARQSATRHRVVVVNGDEELGNLFNEHGMSRTLIPVKGREIYTGAGASGKDVNAAAANIVKVVTASIKESLPTVDANALEHAVEVALQGGIVEQVEAGVTNVLRKGTDS